MHQRRSVHRTFTFDAPNVFDASNVNVAIPDDPSLARVSLTSGTTFSSKPRTNSIEAASKDDDVDAMQLPIDVVVIGNGAKALADAVVNANTAVFNTRW